MKKQVLKWWIPKVAMIVVFYNGLEGGSINTFFWKCGILKHVLIQFGMFWNTLFVTFKYSWSRFLLKSALLKPSCFMLRIFSQIHSGWSCRYEIVRVFLFCKQIFVIFLSVVLLIAADVLLRLIPSLQTPPQGKNARTYSNLYYTWCSWSVISDIYT